MGSVAGFGLRTHRATVPGAALRTGMAPRLIVYAAATALALLSAYLVGKDMGFDTLDYHLYAGFSALHDRFGRDYFAAGPQSYLNPYVYAPFYLLATSGLPAWAAAAILAVTQSSVLWLTFEIGLQVSPAQSNRASWTLAILALLLAFANPILINQLGSSYADVTTAALVLAGWLLLLRAINRPRTASVALAGLLLGAASALKLTNSVHAVAALSLVLFVPGSVRDRARYLMVFGCCTAVAFVMISAPWSLQLESRFGNPLFPLFNGIFHSPQLPTDSLVDHRFIPGSIFEALLRPFEMVLPVRMVDDEIAAADSRYALLVILAIVCLVRLIVRRVRRAGIQTVVQRRAALNALGYGFLLDWVLWLAASGNGRYFIAMACVAAVLVMAVGFRALAGWPRLRGYVCLAIFCFQAMLLTMGAALGGGVSWSRDPWFDVSVPAAMGKTPGLYFLYGDPTNSFIIPFLPKESGFINLGGSYVLGPDGANGARIEALMRRYAPHWSLILRDSRLGEPGGARFTTFTYANAALESFGLRAHPEDCMRIAVHGVAPGVHTGYLLSCHIVRDAAGQAAQSAARNRVDVIFDRLEDACPDLFRPRRPLTEDYPIKGHQEVWVRRYADTGLMALVGRGIVQIADRTRGGPATFVGLQSAWQNTGVKLECGRRNGRYFERRLAVTDRRGKP